MPSVSHRVIQLSVYTCIMEKVIYTIHETLCHKLFDTLNTLRAYVNENVKMHIKIK